MSLSLAANPELRLRSLTLDLGEFDVEHGNLEGWRRELLELSTKNVLEVLDMKLTIRAELYRSEPSKFCTTWADGMDKTLTDRGAFPALRQVNIDLTWYICNTIFAYISNLSGELTEAHFPRLSESAEIRFSLDFEWDGY